MADCTIKKIGEYEIKVEKNTGHFYHTLAPGKHFFTLTEAVSDLSESKGGK